VGSRPEKTDSTSSHTKFSVALHKSIGAKLFYLVSAVVLVVTAVNSWQNGDLFRRYFERNFADSTIAEAKEAAATNAAIMESWISQLALVMHQVEVLPTAERGRTLASLLAASRELVAVQIVELDATGKFQAENFRSTAMQVTEFQDERMQNWSRAKLTTELRRAGLALVNKGSVHGSPSNGQTDPIANLGPTLHLPLLSLAKSFQVDLGSANSGTPSTPHQVWGILTVWQTRMSMALPQSKVVKSRLIDKKGAVIVASDVATTFGGILDKSLIAKAALEAKSANGFREYQLGQSGDWLGSYAQLSHFGLTTIVERSAAEEKLAITTIVGRTALYSVLFVLIAMMVSLAGASRMTASLRAMSSATERIAGGDFDAPVPSAAQDEVGLLGRSVSSMAQRIKALLATEVEKVRIEAELVTASMVQSSFFPKENSKVLEPTHAAENHLPNNVLRIFGTYHPASECGGDWWGHFTAKDGREFVYIGDATGHGTPAAFLTAMAYSNMVTVSKLLRDSTLAGDGKSAFEVTPSSILRRFNEVLLEAFEGKFAMTFFVASFEPKTGKLTYANAGHPFPLVLPANKVNNLDPTVDPLICLNFGGIPLGVTTKVKYKERHHTLGPGDKFYLYTDGLSESRSPIGRSLGGKKLRQIVASSGNLGAAQASASIVGAAFEFYQTRQLNDDLTVVVAEVPADWRPHSQNIPQIDLGLAIKSA